MPRLDRVRAVLRASPAALIAIGLSGAAVITQGQPVLADALFARQPAPRVEVGDVQVASVPDLLPLPADRLAMGVYDPSAAFANIDLDVEQRYLNQADPAGFARALDDLQNSRTALITLEPWPSADSTDPTGLEDVVNGTADANLRAIAAIAARHQPQTILLRWGHEMELADVYPWGAQSPDVYIAAFRHVHAIFAEAGATNVRFVWSPAGNDGAAVYFPGSDVVDYVGVTVLEDAGWDASFGLEPQTFDDLFAPRYDRLAGLGKPIIVTELGVSGSAQRQISWLQDAIGTFNKYPQLRGALYFDAPNPPVNHLPTQPDWRLGPDALVAFQAAWVAPASGLLLA